jgi:CheY-like chemotaxis protein
LLLVEDNPDTLESLRDVLEMEGCRVDTASEGLAAVERALAVKPDAAFIDIGLPGIDGHEVARQIRAGLGGSIYLVALTGYGQPEDKKRAMASGFDFHVTKPLEVDQLHDILSRVAGRDRPPPA